jgi:hypothetical protein
MVVVIIRAQIKKTIDTTAHAIVIAIAVFVNIGVWFIEQITVIEFEMLSVSYIISELFLLGVHLVMKENQQLRTIVKQVESVQHYVENEKTAPDAVLEQPLKGCYEELDVMATPTGKPVVLVHCNNCTGEIDAWVELISQIMGTMGAASAKDQIYRMLYEAALNGADDTLVYNYISGEHIPHVERGVPMLLRAGGTPLNLNGVARGLIYSAVATLRMGMDVLTQNEDVRISCVTAHGGFFKTPRVGQLVVSAALKLPVAVMETAGEGGAWAMALLALYAVDKRGETLEAFLENRIFGDCPKTVLEADSAQQADFDRFMVQFQRGLKAERFASEIYGAENACV